MAEKNKKLTSMAKQFSGLPIKELIGAPLVAAAQANNMMAMSQTKFLLDTCFVIKQVGDREVYKPVMINMTLTRPVVNADGTGAQSVESEFNLPLLTIVPINSLAVDDVNVNFEMEVKSSFTSERKDQSKQEEKNEESISRKIDSSHITAELTGEVAASNATSSHDASSFKKSNSAKYEIKAHAGQIPLPVGVTTIIDTFSKSMAPITLKPESNRE